jgi:hypothetical protein
MLSKTLATISTLKWRFLGVFPLMDPQFMLGVEGFFADATLMVAVPNVPLQMFVKIFALGKFLTTELADTRFVQQRVILHIITQAHCS